MLHRARCLAALLITALLSAGASAQDLPDGDEVVRRINARDEGTGSVRDLTIELTDKRGKQRVRETRGFRKLFDDGERTVLFFRSPSNIRDTAILTYDYDEPGREDDQWLYLPALRKVRRISAANRGDYFLGTDFTYEDIKKGQKVAAEDYHFKTLRRDQLGDRQVLVVEGIPVSEQVADELGYGRVLMWVDPELWMSRKTEIWDPHSKPLKTIESFDVREIDGIWTAHRLEVRHLQNDHRTVFTFKDVRYGVDVDDALFTEGALRRGL